MIPITSTQVTQETLSLFDLTKPTMPRAFNVLEGITRGDILVDERAHPTAAVAHESIYEPARKLEYCNEQEYRYVRWPKL